MFDIGSLFDYDYERMVIYLVIANSNVQSIVNIPEKFTPFAATNVIIPAELQRPATRSAIARATGLPRETVRRKVAGMIDSGMLTADAKGGLILTPGILASRQIAELLAKNEANVRRLVRQVTPLI